MSRETHIFHGVILPNGHDLRDIANGETTIGFKYDGIGCVLGCVLINAAILLNIIFYSGRYMLIHSILCVVIAAVTALPIAIIKKDYETYIVRRYLAIAGPLIIAPVWFFSGGASAPSGYIWMFAIVAYNSSLVTGKKGKWYVSYAILVNLIAMLLCVFCPQLLVPVSNERHLMWFNIFSIVCVCAYLGATMWFQRKIAENLQDKQAEYNEELIALNEEIESNTRIQTEMKLREEQLHREKKQAEETTLLLVQTLSNTIETRDEYLRGHSGRVSDYSVKIAQKMGLPEESVNRIKLAAQLHDIGKIGISDMVLNKPSRLTDEEYALIKSHSSLGSDLLKDIDIISYTADIARHHHERYDGKGYPDGLKGEEISLDARIVAVADSFDAMNSKRVYRDPMDKSVIRSEILKNRGTQFDPAVADAFLALYDAGEIG